MPHDLAVGGCAHASAVLTSCGVPFASALRTMGSSPSFTASCSHCLAWCGASCAPAAATKTLAAQHSANDIAVGRTQQHARVAGPRQAQPGGSGTARFDEPGARLSLVRVLALGV